MTNTRPTSCLVATDLSGRSDRALVRAFRIAARGGGRVVALHVVEEDYPRRLSKTMIEDITSELRTQITAMPESKGVHWTVRVERGHDYECITDVARSQGVNLLVMGGRRDPKLTDIVLSSTAQRVVRQATTPVLVVKTPYRGPYGLAVAAVDASPHCRQGIAFAMDAFPELFVSAFHAKGGIVPSVLPDDLPPQRCALTEAEADAVAAPLLALPDFDRRGEFVALSGDTTDALRAFVREKRPDLLIAGQSKSARSFFLGEDLPGFAMLSIDRDILIMP